jgi:single stranded DNA-binding protein
MAFDMEKITLVGSIQPADAETRFTSDGKPIVSFKVVCGRGKWNADTREYDNESDWFSVTMFGDRSAKQADKLVKGTKVVVTGNFAARPYETRGGESRLSLDVAADTVIVVAPPRDGNQRMPQSQAVAPSAFDDTDLPF